MLTLNSENLRNLSCPYEWKRYHFLKWAKTLCTWSRGNQHESELLREENNNDEFSF